MKICLINNILKPYDRGGGSENYSHILVDSLRDQGYKVFTISLRPFLSKNSRCNFPENSYYLKSFFYSLSKIILPLRLIWHLYDLINPFNYYKIKKILLKEKPDIIITNNLKGVGLASTNIIKKINAKHIHILHDLQLIHPSGLVYYGHEKVLNSISTKIYSFITSRIIKSPDMVISPSNWLLKLHKKFGFFGKSQTKVMPNPAPDIKSTSTLKKDTPKQEIFRFLYVGQLEKHKGIFELLNVFSKIVSNEESSNASLTVSGSGTLFNSLKSRFNKVCFKGKLPRAEVLNIMNNSDCLIVPSLCYENSPSVIYEASAMGICTIAARIGGIEELIKNLSGLLYEPGSLKKLEEKMLWALKNKDEIKKIGLKSQSKISKYGNSKYMNDFISLLKSI